MGLRRSFRWVPTVDVSNKGIDSSVVDSNRIRRNRERGRGGGERLSMIAMKTQVENSLGLHLRCS